MTRAAVARAPRPAELHALMWGLVLLTLGHRDRHRLGPLGMGCGDWRATRSCSSPCDWALYTCCCRAGCRRGGGDGGRRSSRSRASRSSCCRWWASTCSSSASAVDILGRARHRPGRYEPSHGAGGGARAGGVRQRAARARAEGAGESSGGGEGVIVSTCNRVEVVACGPTPRPSAAAFPTLPGRDHGMATEASSCGSVHARRPRGGPYLFPRGSPASTRWSSGSPDPRPDEGAVRPAAGRRVGTYTAPLLPTSRSRSPSAMRSETGSRSAPSRWARRRSSWRATSSTGFEDQTALLSARARWAS